MSQSAYREPLYYDVAFGFVDTPKQIDLFEQYIKKYCKRKVNSVLDIGCGPSLQLIEMASRGYKTTGLDNSSEMLNYLKAKAKELGLVVGTKKANMHKFKLNNKVDFAFNMMGTISYCTSNAEFSSHLSSVANSLNKGGLYLIENFRLDWSKNLFKFQTWTMKSGGIKVKTIYQISVKDHLEQLLDEKMDLIVEDNGKKKVLKERTVTKMIFPQELLALIEQNGRFEFIGWFERDQIKPIKEATNDNMVLLRKK